MKKITLLFYLLLLCSSFSQSTTTGERTLSPGFTVQFDYDDINQEVTMTLKGPSDVWLGVGLDAQSMDYTNADVIIYTNSGLKDYYLDGDNADPSLDTNNWTLLTDDVVSGERTIIAKRSSNTGESTDYVFTSTIGSVPVIWAKGNSLSFGYHGNRGTSIIDFILSTNDVVQKSFEVYPNPTVDELNFDFPNNVQSANVQVYNILGRQIMQTQLKRTFPKLDTNAWASGMYVVQIITEDAVQTKRIIKQ